MAKMVISALAEDCQGFLEIVYLSGKNQLPL
jgi:hypothetical protein